MVKYRLSNEAKNDQIRIHQYGVENFGMVQADKYFNSFFEYFDIIAERPFSFNENLRLVNQISIIPTWGIKRNIGDHFTFETGFGIGYRYYFAKSVGYLENQKEGAINLHLRIGYRF